MLFKKHVREVDTDTFPLLIWLHLIFMDLTFGCNLRLYDIRERGRMLMIGSMYSGTYSIRGTMTIFSVAPGTGVESRCERQDSADQPKIRGALLAIKILKRRTNNHDEIFEYMFS